MSSSETLAGNLSVPCVRLRKALQQIFVFLDSEPLVGCCNQEDSKLTHLQLIFCYQQVNAVAAAVLHAE